MTDLATANDTWVAIDFETATGDRASACSIGVAVVECGFVTHAGAWLIQPPGNVYDARNVAVHGIEPEMTEYAPTYAELYDRIEPLLNGRRLLAHSASFDVSVVRGVHAYYDLPLPDATYACTVQMARRAFPALGNHRLPTVCDHCGIPLDHHDAASDALACARVAVGCRDAIGASTIAEALDVLGVQARGL